jgi:predicted metal-dependent phosphoesterase TrpH
MKSQERRSAAAAAESGLAFVPGVEISVTWAGKTIHVVGLGVDDLMPVCAGLEQIRSAGAAARAPDGGSARGSGNRAG